MHIYIYIFINNRFVVYRKRSLFHVYEGNMSTCCIFLLCSTSMAGIIIQQFHEFQAIYVCNPQPQPLQDNHLDFDCCSQSASKQIDWTEHISCEVDDGCPVAHFGCNITLNSENILKASWCRHVGNFPQLRHDLLSNWCKLKPQRTLWTFWTFCTDPSREGTTARNRRNWPSGPKFDVREMQVATPQKKTQI